MKPLKDQVLNWVPEIAKLVGTQTRRITEKYDDYVEVPGDGCVLRVRWEIERESALIVTLYKDVKERYLAPHEIGLVYFVRFSGGSDADVKTLSRSNVLDADKLVKKYALSYLRGQEKDFDAVIIFANRVVEQETTYSQWRKANKWVRPEWLS